MIFILFFSTIFDSLDAPTYYIRASKTTELIKRGIEIVPEIDKQLDQINSTEKTLRLQYIRLKITRKYEIEQHANLLRRHKQSNTVGWSVFSVIVGDSYSARKFYHHLYKLHGTHIKLVFSSEHKEETAIIIAQELRQKRSLHWNINSLLYFFEHILDINLNINPGNGYYYDPPIDYLNIYKQLRD